MSGENSNGPKQPRWAEDFLAAITRMARSGQPDLRVASHLAQVNRSYVARYRHRHPEFDRVVTMTVLRGRLVDEARRRRERLRRQAEAEESDLSLPRR